MTNPRRASSKAATKSAPSPATQAGATSKAAKAGTDAQTTTTPTPAATMAATAALAASASTSPTDEKAVQRIEEQDATERAALSQVQESAVSEADNSLEARAADNGLGMIEVRPTGQRYVGVSPQRKKPGTVSKLTGFVLNGQNTIFTPLQNVPYEPGFLVEDPKSGEFYSTPQSSDMGNDPRRWLEVKHPETGNPLVGESTKEGQAARRRAAGLEEK